jgi:deoxycytidine triphosphate deaminase
MVEYTRFVDGIVHEPTQTEGRGLDLTVDSIYEVTEPGRVDFGGGELEDATVTPHESGTRNPEDDYEWWDLAAGTYLVEYNESISTDDMTLTVQTREALLERGVSHPTVQVTNLPRVPLTVCGSGIRIKENARISTIVGATSNRDR